MPHARLPLSTLSQRRKGCCRRLSLPESLVRRSQHGQRDKGVANEAHEPAQHRLDRTILRHRRQASFLGCVGKQIRTALPVLSKAVSSASLVLCDAMALMHSCNGRAQLLQISRSKIAGSEELLKLEPGSFKICRALLTMSGGICPEEAS